MIDFEFGESKKANEFFDRNPTFFSAFEHVTRLANKCFGRPVPTDSDLNHICFDLGQTCLQDYLEIILLGVNGYGTGALKLLRGLYERAVTAAYIILFPEKAMRFQRYTAIHNYKAIQKAQKVSPAALQESLSEFGFTIDEFKDAYESAKPDFQETDCEECGTKRTAYTWDVDFASMVERVKQGYDGGVFLTAYTIPTLSLHATFISTLHNRASDQQAAASNERNGYLSVLTATFLLMQVIRLQNAVFKLNLDADIDACQNEPFMLPREAK
jgi:hypothetical protein